MTYANYVATFLITGGGVAIAAGLFKIGNMLGQLDSTIQNLTDRVDRIESHLNNGS